MAKTRLHDLIEQEWRFEKYLSGQWEDMGGKKRVEWRKDIAKNNAKIAKKVDKILSKVFFQGKKKDINLDLTGLKDEHLYSLFMYSVGGKLWSLFEYMVDKTKVVELVRDFDTMDSKIEYKKNDSGFKSNYDKIKAKLKNADVPPRVISKFNQKYNEPLMKNAKSK